LQRFAQEEEKEKELDDEFYKIAGISRETVWIQRSPPGSGPYGIDFAGPLSPLNEKIVDWREQE